MKLYNFAATLILAALSHAKGEQDKETKIPERQAVEIGAGEYLIEGTKLCRPRQARCASSSSSSSSSSSDCCNQCSKVFYDYMDFYTSFPVFNTDPNIATWEYWVGADGATNYTADHGSWSVGCNGGFLRSVFSTDDVLAQTSNPDIDHNKFFGFSSTPMPVPVHGDAVVKFRGTVSTFKSENNPFPITIVERNDFRMAHGRFITFDSTTGLEFSFLLTNTRVYAFYQRTIPLDTTKAGETPNDGAAGFAFLVPVKIRKICDWHDMAIVLHGDTQTISWHLDDREVFIISKPGFHLDRDYMVNDIGGAETVSFPQSIQYGFGTFSAVDWYPACHRDKSCARCSYPPLRQALVDVSSAAAYEQFNPIFGDIQPAVFWDNTGNVDNQAWGQGVNMQLHKLIAYTKVAVCK